MVKILIVEDEHIVAMELKSRLNDLGYSVCGAVATGEEAISKSIEIVPDLILMDINIKGGFDGVEAAKRIKKLHEIPIIFLTAFTDDKTLERAKVVEPYGYIVKPFEERELHTTIEIAVHKYKMERKLKENERKLSTILKSIGDAVIATDNCGKINFINYAFKFITGFDESESIDKNIFDVFHIEDENAITLVKQGVENILKNNIFTDFPSQINIITKSKKTKIVEFKISTLLDDNKLLNGIVLIFHDITDEYQSALEVVESEMKYRKVVENVSDIIFTMDLNGQFIFVNSAGLRISEYALEELKEVSYLDLILPSHQNHCKYILMKQYITKQKHSYMEYPFKSKTGKVSWLAQNNTLIIINNKIVGYDVIARDITEKKLAEKELNERNRFIETVLGNIQIGLSVHEIDSGKIIYTNSKFREITGVTHKEVDTTKDLFNLVLPDKNDKDRINYKILRKLHSSKSFSGKCDDIIISPPGQEKKNISLSLVSLLEQNIIIATTQDITLQRTTEEKILRLSYAVNQSPAAVLITDRYGKIVYSNPKCSEITGYTFDELLGMRPCALHTQDGLPDDEHEITKTVRNGKEIRGEYLSYRKDRSSYWEFITISPIKDNNNIITNFVIIKQDISDQKRYENEIIEAKEKAEESSRLKCVFLGNMSHELRTPMVGILGFAQILKEELENDEQRELADLLIKSGKRLLNTLESILEFSQLESNRANLNIDAIDLASSADYLYNKFKEQADTKKLEFNILPLSEDVFVLGDQKLLNHALSNIIDNAIKFTYKGEVNIGIDKIIFNGKQWGKISISDTGIGISKEQQKIIFEDFRQVSEGTSRSFEGNGLGLAISKKIINLMQGEITVESSPAIGSTFIVLIPLTERKDNNNNNGKNDMAKISEPQKILGQLKTNGMPEVLLVEDNETNKEVIELYLKKVCKIEYASEGKSALAMASQKKYALILMDINLGNGLNGIEVTKEIRKMKGYKDTPIVALTGYAMFGDKEKLLTEGCSHYMSKPFMKKEIVQLVQELLYPKKDCNNIILN